MRHKPTGMTSIAFSFAGRSSNSPRKAMGLGVCVKVSSPIACTAAMKNPATMPHE